MANEIPLEKKLQERVKELSCLYAVSSAIRKHSESVPDTLRNICDITKKAWLYAPSAIVECQLDKIKIKTSDVPLQSVYQTSDIKIFGETRGHISVHYDKIKFNQTDFLPEEHTLLDKIAIEISEFIERLETKQKEEILKRGIERNDRLSILGEITAGIAHELNTPLGNILGFAELIKSNTKEDQTQKDIEKILKAGIYSREVVKKLMFFACEMPQHKEFILIKPVIDQALKLLGPNFKKAKIEHIFHIENPELEAQLDAIQFTQVLFNLLINAMYVAPENSTITIDVSSDSNNLILKIKDEGPGIPSDLKSKVFEPFFTTKPVGDGSGLGLSVVHGIVKSHRGEIITFDNKPCGTVFQINLPLKM